MDTYMHGVLIVKENGSFGWNAFGSEDRGVLDDIDGWEKAIRRLGDYGWEMFQVSTHGETVTYWFKHSN